VKHEENFQQKHIDEINQKICIEFKKASDFYCIGIDQGVNSLVSYCVIDKNGNIVKDEQGKAEIGDLSLVISTGENKGKFVEVEETEIVNDDNGKGIEQENGTWVCALEKANDRVLSKNKTVEICDYAEKIYAESYKRKKEIDAYNEGDEIIFDKTTNLNIPIAPQETIDYDCDFGSPTVENKEFSNIIKQIDDIYSTFTNSELSYD
jgi:hypothetical protein